MNAARKKIEVDDPWLSLPRAAAELETSKYLVLMAIAAGELTASRSAGRTVVSKDSVAKLKEARAAAV